MKTKTIVLVILLVLIIGSCAGNHKDYPVKKTVRPLLYPVRWGKVLAISSDKKKVVINLGEKSDVIVGMKFTVYRETRRVNYIGEIKITEVKKDYSLCLIISLQEGQQIRENDKITSDPCRFPM